MTKPKSKVETEKFGKVAILTTSYVGEKWKTRFQTVCRRQTVPKHLQRQDWQTFEDAKTFAIELDNAIRTGEYKHLLQEENKELNEIARRIKTEKLLHDAESTHQISGNKSKPLWATYLDRETTLTDLFEAGKRVIEISTELNEARHKAGLQPWTTHVFLEKLRENSLQYAQKMKRPTYKEMIARRLHFLCGRSGGKGRRELEKVTKKEWTEKLKNLESWIGNLSVGEESELVLNKIRNGIDNSINKSGRNIGNSWSSQTRFKQASKISQFGAWLYKEKMQTGWEENYFSNLPEEYKNFDPKTKSTTLTAEEVERIFLVAMRKENRNLLPYVVFMFFSTARPFELADPATPSRRFKWKWMDGWEIDSDVTGGKLFTLPPIEDNKRKSKINTERQADLTQTGFKWMCWWAEKKNLKLKEFCTTQRP